MIEALKKRDATSPETAVPLKVFKDLPLQTNTLSYTIGNLIEEGIVVQTPEEKYYYDEIGFKALEMKFVRGYSMFSSFPLRQCCCCGQQASICSDQPDLAKSPEVMRRHPMFSRFLHPVCRLC